MGRGAALRPPGSAFEPQLHYLRNHHVLLHGGQLYFGTNDYFIMQPLGSTQVRCYPPLTFRWFFQYLDTSGAQMTELMERISPYFVTTPQAFLVVILESAVFLTLIALVYKRQSC